MKPLVSVIVPAYNEEKYITRCLSALTNQQTSCQYEVIIVDNASTDATSQIAQTFPVKVVKEVRKGTGRARQTGVEHAKGDYLLSTDADTIVPVNWIEAMTDQLKNGYQAISGPMKIDEMSLLSRAVVNIGQPIIVKLYKYIYGYYYLSGFNSGVTRALIERVGGFNVNLKSLDDIEISQRISKIVEIKFLPDVVVTTSARRFKSGLVRGLWDYARALRTLQKTQEPIMSDIR